MLAVTNHLIVLPDACWLFFRIRFWALGVLVLRMRVGGVDGSLTEHDEPVSGSHFLWRPVSHVLYVCVTSTNRQTSSITNSYWEVQTMSIRHR